MSHQQEGSSSPRRMSRLLSLGVANFHDRVLESYSSKAKDFVDLHDQVQERSRFLASLPNQTDIGSH